MANRYQVSTMYGDSDNDVLRVPIIRSAIPMRGVIMPRGVIPVPHRDKTITYYAQLDNTLQTGNFNEDRTRGCGTFNLPLDCEIGAWTTPTGLMDGIKMQDETVTIRLRGKYWKLAGAPAIGGVRRIRFKLYHVDTSNIETLLASGDSLTLTTSWAVYTFTKSFSQLWEAGERLRIRVFGFLQEGEVGE